MDECFGKYYVLNGELQSADTFDNSMVYEGDSVYEVIRIVRGAPVFFDDHAARLEASSRFQNKPLLADSNTLKKEISLLLLSEQQSETNLKIVFNYNNDKTSRLIYFIEPVYPSQEQYREGVRGILYHAERKDPASKVINHRLRSEIYHRLIMENAYEALLVNRHNCITEGSRSNIFFIKGNRLTTAPDGEVLNGITRMHIIEICHEKGIEIDFECVNADRMTDYESVFMSGTSPVALPFYQIGDMTFNVHHPLISLLRMIYLARAEDSMRQFAGENPLQKEH